jgi:N6-L-threonylcarbamoyladenine synthase
MTYVLGIDTSAYTTSLALVDQNHQLLADERILLQVKEGGRGLRQSEALFQHIKNLPSLFERIAPQGANKIAAIAVSAFPRPLPGSYMPVFLAGLSQAHSLGSINNIPCYEVSHQEGHIMAGVYGSPELLQSDAFLAVHFSGGTSEILKVRRGERTFYDIELRGSGSDLHAGQLVDRVGVAMGLPFPSGPSLEKLALKAGHSEITIPSSVRNGSFSFSGAENQALSYIKQGYPHDQIALAVLKMIANTLEKMLLTECEQSGIRDVLLVGGVMANSIIKNRLLKRLEHPAVGLRLHFAAPGLSTDNAVGVALIGSYLNKS